MVGKIRSPNHVLNTADAACAVLGTRYDMVGMSEIFDVYVDFQNNSSMDFASTEKETKKFLRGILRQTKS